MNKLFDNINNSSNLITGHINPDGDALGSALAFKLILDSKGIDSDVCFDIKGNIPSNLNHLITTGPPHSTHLIGLKMI